MRRAGEVFEADRTQAAGDFALERGAAQALQPQAEGDVLVDAQMRKQGVGLEHQSDLPLVGGERA